MKLILFTKFPPDLDGFIHGGGISRYLFYLINILKGEFSTVYVVSSNETVKKIHHENVIGIHLNSPLHSRLKSLQRISLFFRILANIYEAFLIRRWIVKNVDITKDAYMEFEDIESPTLFVPRNLNYSVRLHANYISLKNYILVKSFWYKILAILDKIAIKRAPKVSAPSEYQLREMKQAGAINSNTKTSLIYNYIEPLKCISVLKSEGGLRLNILCLERIEFRKGVDVILDALPELDNKLKGQKVKFHFCGSIRDLRPLVEKTNRTQFDNIDIEFYGNVQTSMLEKLLSSADIFLAPSRYETFSYTLFEAMSVGSCILASNSHVNREFLVNEESGKLYDKFDPQSFVEAFLSMLKGDRQKLSRNALQRFSQIIDLNQIKNKYLGFANSK